MGMSSLRIFRFRSPGKGRIRYGLLDCAGAIAIRWSAASSVEEIMLAHHLAENAFAKKANIARDIRYEFLLWVSGKTDIRSAMESTAPEAGGDFFVLVFPGDKKGPGAAALGRILDARKLPLGLKKEGDALALERISLSRIRN